MSPDRSGLGIIAGGGRVPALIIDKCRTAGWRFFVIGLAGHVDPAILAADVPHAVVRLGAAGRAIRILKENGAGELVLAGDVRRPSLLGLWPDWRTVGFLLRAGGFRRGDDALLSRVVRDLERHDGFRVVGVHQILPELLAGPGVYGAVAPDQAALADIEIGIKAAREVGAKDKGQGAVVRTGLVLAREGRDGTDAMLARLAGAQDVRSGVLVKTRKPGQEERADLPTIGIRTIERAAGAGLAGIAIEAGGALVVERKGLVAAADAAGLFVMGVNVPEGETP